MQSYYSHVAPLCLLPIPEVLEILFFMGFFIILFCSASPEFIQSCLWNCGYELSNDAKMGSPVSKHLKIMTPPPESTISQYFGSNG